MFYSYSGDRGQKENRRIFLPISNSPLSEINVEEATKKKIHNTDRGLTNEAASGDISFIHELKPTRLEPPHLILMPRLITVERQRKPLAVRELVPQSM